MSSDSVKLMIAEGEGLTVEFNERFTPRILEGMVAFANGRGGRILFEVTTFFKAIFYRNPEYSLKATQKTREKTRERILRIIRENPMITVLELAQKLEISPKGIEWNLTKAKKEGLLRRVGPDKGGRWEVSIGWEKR